MIVVLGGVKGGTGKSTAATNLAVMRALDGHEVLLVDADDQASSYTFSEIRGESKPDSAFSCIKLTGVPVGRECRKLSAKYHDIIVDTGGRDTASQRSALSVADLVLVPFKPRSFDIWTLEQASRIIVEAMSVNERLCASTFLSMADPQGSDNREAAQLLEELEVLTFSELSLGNRKAFANAATNGLAVTELKPSDWKAEREVKAMYEYVFDTPHIRPTFAEDMPAIQTV